MGPKEASRGNHQPATSNRQLTNQAKNQANQTNHPSQQGTSNNTTNNTQQARWRNLCHAAKVTSTIKQIVASRGNLVGSIEHCPKRNLLNKKGLQRPSPPTLGGIDNNEQTTTFSNTRDFGGKPSKPKASRDTGLNEQTLQAKSLKRGARKDKAFNSHSPSFNIQHEQSEQTTTYSSTWGLREEDPEAQSSKPKASTNKPSKEV